MILIVVNSMIEERLDDNLEQITLSHKYLDNHKKVDTSKH